MNKTILASVLAVSLGFGFAASAQSPPVGGPAAKGNAPLKAVHTVNDGSARPGANSFTQGQARQHILNSGYTDVSGLAKGQDGVWRGMATHNGSQVAVAMDFKGNVTEAMPEGSGSAMVGSGSADSAAPAEGAGMGAATGAGASAGAMTTGHRHHHHLFHRHHRRHMRRCSDPRPNGAACSGVDRNNNGVSDKEDRALQNGAKP